MPNPRLGAELLPSLDGIVDRRCDALGGIGGSLPAASPGPHRGAAHLTVAPGKARELDRPESEPQDLEIGESDSVRLRLDPVHDVERVERRQVLNPEASRGRFGWPVAIRSTGIPSRSAATGRIGSA